LLTRLFEPISLSRTSLPNRVVMTAINLNYTPGGEVTDRFIEYYGRRARAGAGLIIVGGVEPGFTIRMENAQFHRGIAL
jgi:2,4-dienoyl-CoA reductase (NADPH2)